MNNSTILSPTRHRLATGWSFADILFVAGFSLAGVLGFALGFSFVAPWLGLGQAGAFILDQPVVASAISGTVVYGIVLAAIYVCIIRRRKVGWGALGFRRPPLLPMLLAPIIAIGQLMALAITNLVVIQLIGEFENPQIEAISGGQGFSWLNYLLMLLLAGVVAPVVEEILFRGVLYGWLRSRLPIAAAVILGAAIFAAAHVVPVLLPALFVVGLFLVLAYEFTGSLWLPILLHAIQNSLVVTLIFVALALDLTTSV